MVMKQTLDLLVIEDSEDDYQLLLRQIKSGWKEVNAIRIETPEEFEKALEKDWDAILSDNTLPRFSAISALQQLREIDDNIPFILVSGTIGEKQAVEAMRYGANDYILKSDYGRLLPAMQRELK